MQNSEEYEILSNNKNKKKYKKSNKQKSIPTENKYKKFIFFIYILLVFVIFYFLRLIIINFQFSSTPKYINHKLNYNITPINSSLPKRKIYVKYIDFWPAFNITKFDIHSILQERYDVIFSETPDYVFYSEFGRKSIGIENKTDCIKIFISIENRKPNFLYCDYAIGLRYIDNGDRYFRKPTDTSKLSQLYSIYNISKAKNITTKNKKFCAWVVSNSFASTRNLFFEKLSEYKKVDSGGRYKNNIGYYVKNKKEFLKDYKFSICFENSKNLGYVTEKIFDAFEAGTIPIYFGDDSLPELINTKAYIHVKNKNDFNNKIELIKKIDQDDTLYESMIKEKIVLNDSLYEQEFLKYKNFIYHIIEQDKQKAKRFKRAKDE